MEVSSGSECFVAQSDSSESVWLCSFSLSSQLPWWSAQPLPHLLFSFRIFLINICLLFVWRTPRFRCVHCPQFFQKSRCCADFRGILISPCRPQTHQNCHFMDPESHPFETIVIVLWIQELLEFARENHQNASDASKVYINVLGPDWMSECEKIQKVWLSYCDLFWKWQGTKCQFNLISLAFCNQLVLHLSTVGSRFSLSVPV